MAERGPAQFGIPIIISGQLEVDQNRGVIYFHSETTGSTILRICNLPHPIPDENISASMIDIAHMTGVNYLPKER